MKTWQMIKELTENPNKKFKDKFNNIVFVDKDNFIRIETSRGSTDLFRKNIEEDWEVVKEPVDFMTAVKSGKKVRVEHECIHVLCKEIYGREDCIYDYNLLRAIAEGEYRDLVVLLGAICDHTLNGDIQEIISNGKWYILDK